MPPPPPSLQAPVFSRVLDAFRSTLTPEDREDFKYTKLEDLQRFIQDLQNKQGRKAQNLARLKPFLEGMEQYGKIVEVFLNLSDVVAFVWGPTKFVLQVASNYTEAFDELLDMYSDIGESLPILAQYETLFERYPYMGQVLELIYVDILDFNRKAYRYFKQRVWKQVFRATWKTFRSQFGFVIDNLRRHKKLVETQASLTQFKEIQEIRLQAAIEFGEIRKAEELRRRKEVLEWLSPANWEEDQAVKAQVRNDYPGVCSWILEQKSIQKWRDLSKWNDSQPLLWIYGIPGAGKTVAASFLVEELQRIPSATTLFFYCKHEDRERNSFVAIARALIEQAVRHDNTILSYVYEKAASCGEIPLKTTKTAEDILEVALKSLGSVYVVIDGLDECEVTEESIIASWFKSFANIESQNSATHIRCLFLSQADRETSKLLKFVPQFSICHEGLARDICVFCEVEGAKIKRKFGLSEFECEEIVKKVSTEAQGMFLYAKLVMKNLFDQTRIVHLRRELEPGTFPNGIDKAYGRIVERILLCSELHPSEKEDTRQLLGLLVCAKRSLKWTEIQGAVSIDLKSQNFDYEGRHFLNDSKYLCGSLVEIRPGGAVDLVHMTAKQYLLNKKYLCLNEEELGLSRLCLGYLSLNCFDHGLPEHTIQEFILAGYYTFADYAIAHWTEHILEVIEYNDAEDLKSVHVVIETFLENHCNPGAHEKVTLFENRMYETASIQPQQTFGEMVATLEESLDLEQVLRQIRSVMENLSASEETRLRLETLYGPNLFKCPRIDCNQFFEGFRELNARHQHQKKHDRPFYCTIEGCLAVQTGFMESSHLKHHINKIHTPFESYHFPDSGVLVDDKIEQAIENSDIVLLEQLLDKKEGGIEYTSGYLEYSGCGRSTYQWWLTAMQRCDDDVINILTRYTDFSKASAQLNILLVAIRAKRTDLVRRFSRDDFFCANPNAITPSLKGLPSIALKDDNVDVLRILLGDSMALHLSISFRDLAVKASRSGSLACIQYLISEHGIDPLQYDPPRKVLKSGTLAEHRSHSLLYNGVEAGQTAVCRFILNATKGQDVSRPEDDDTLIGIAARNGYELILKMLIESSNLTDPSKKEQYISRAKLYNDIRYHKKDVAKSLLYTDFPGLDKPDAGGCSLLMYAALHGLLSTVEYLISVGANINRKGNCSEISVSPTRYQTALLMAVYNGHEVVVRRLLQCPDITLTGRLTFRSGAISKQPYTTTSDGDIYKVAKLRFPVIAEILREHQKAVEG